MRKLPGFTCLFNIRDFAEVGVERGEHCEDAALQWRVVLAKMISSDEIQHKFLHLKIPNNDCLPDRERAANQNII